ncbi:MAG: hypothetical protein D3X82_13220 [Candidatus Leucobacter sulfamidivorax]|nr:hypothetical protein [Candidatus Leucobacter sulfamidivorax]
MWLIPYVIDGIVLGALYAIVSLGMVIVYQATRVLNFAQAGIATTSAFVAWKLIGLGWSYPLALLAAVACGIALGGLVGILLAALSRRTTPLARTVMTFGVTLILTWVNREAFGNDAQFIPRVMDSDIELFGIRVNGHGLYIIVIAAVTITATLLLLFKTRIGLAMRALSQDPETAQGHGIGVSRITVASWGIASALGGLSGVLVASFINIDHQVMTTILIYSLIAQVIGGFGSPLGAIIGGVALGVSSSIMSATPIADYRTVVVFGAMLLILLIRPYGIVGKPELHVAESGGQLHGPRLPGRLDRRAIILPLVVVGAALLIPVLPIPWSLSVFTVMFGTAIAVVALSTLLGYTGEMSVGHGAFVLTGGYTFAILANAFPQIALPFLLLAAIGAAALLGFIVGIFALRLSGLYLMIVTIVVNFTAIEATLHARQITGGATGLALAQGPWLVIRFDSNTSIYWLAATLFLLTWLVTAAVLRSRIGQRWIAARDSPRASSAFGLRPNLQRVGAFVYSSAITGLAGAVLCIAIAHIGPTSYGLHWSIFLLLAVVIGGLGSMAGALVGAAVITLVPIALSRSSGAVDLVFGVALIMVLAFAPDGIRSFRSLASRRRKPASGSGEGSERDSSAVRMEHSNA